MWPSLQRVYGLPEYRANFEKIVFFDNDDRNFETYKRTDFPATGVEALLNKFDYTTGQIQGSTDRNKEVHIAPSRILGPVSIPIKTVKVNDCGEGRLPKKRLNECTNKFVSNMQSEENENVKNHFSAILNICSKYNYDDYFDGMSGLTKEMLQSNLNDDDIFVFDWDRTITQCEGVLFSVPDFPTYHLGLKTYGKVDNLSTDIKDHVKAICGGTNRYNMLVEQFQKLDVDKTYIVTNNPNRRIILQMMKCIMPDIRDDHVYSMHEHKRMNGKMELISTLISQQYKTDKLRPQKIDDELLIAAATPITQLYNEEEDL